MIMKRLLFVSLPVGLLIFNGSAQPPTIELHGSGWRGYLMIVKPDTVIGWHRQRFRWYWTWKHL